MSNDKAQELTKTINDSIATLCAETDAAKQSATYKAWLNTVSRFYHYKQIIGLLTQADNSEEEKESAGKSGTPAQAQADEEIAIAA